MSKKYSAIIFDCDGVLIDSSRSYDLALERTAQAFGALLGFQLQSKELYNTIEALRKLGTFNNDWDTLAVLTAYMYSRSKERGSLQSLAALSPLSRRIQEFEANALKHSSGSNAPENNGKILDLLELNRVLQSCSTGVRYDALVSMLLKDTELRQQFYSVVSYPGSVGESLLATFFDEVMYGAQVFKSTYGFECATRSLSRPGLITNEKALVKDSTLNALKPFCEAFGIITGRPKTPTMYTLSRLFEYFSDPKLCEFTGDYALGLGESKPSPKPMLRVASGLKDKQAPILYVGDSGEDLLFVQRINASKELGEQQVLFCGVATGEEKKAYFRRQAGLELAFLISDVNELPSVLGAKEPQMIKESSS